MLPFNVIFTATLIVTETNKKSAICVYTLPVKLDKKVKLLDYKDSSLSFFK